MRCACRHAGPPRYNGLKTARFLWRSPGIRDQVRGTVASANGTTTKAFYTGQIDNPRSKCTVATTTDAAGTHSSRVSRTISDEFPVPAKGTVDRGQERYNFTDRLSWSAGMR